jgi:GGDEF domain-containing protein
MAGLVVPLHKGSVDIAYHPQNLPAVGEALIGWLKLNGSFYTFLDATPSFEVPSDFRMQPLVVTEDDQLKEDVPQDNTLIVVQRKAKPLNLSHSMVETIRHLLEPVYCNIDLWRSAFDYGMRDWLYQATDFTSSIDPSDDILNDLMDMVIELGSKTNQGQDHWRFCCLLLPDDPTLPLQHRSLIIQAQSKRSPYKKLGMSSVSSELPGLSLRAYQSGSVIYRPSMSAKDFIIAYREQEEAPRSAIAIPIAREDGLSIAVLYIASDEVDAFSEKDQRVLRFVGMMVEELLLTYSARQQATGKLADLINTPDVVDASFKNFYSENDFIRDLETLLVDIQSESESEYRPGEEVSFIAIDIDNQSALATKYGDRVARNLSKEAGERVRSSQKLFEKLANRRLYHVSADRYYLLLKDMSLEDARTNAEQIRLELKKVYRIDQQRISDGKPKLRDSMLELSNVTVRLGVTSYKYQKLKEVLQRFSFESAVSEVGALITGSLNEVLRMGRPAGGDIIISWDHEQKKYITLPPTKPLNTI